MIDQKTTENGFVGLLGHGTSLAAPFLFLFFGLVSALQAQINYNTANYNSGSYTYTTIATAYAPSGAGACGFPAANDPSHTAAINSNSGGGGDDYQNGLACGACAALTVTGAAEAITVMIDNACPSCSAADQLDLTQATWQALTGNTNYGQLNIQWKFVPCPLSLMAGDSSGDITYEWKSGCSSGYDPIQFMDSLFPITSVGFSTSNTGPFTALTLGANGVGGNNYWGTTSGNLNGTSGTFLFQRDGWGWRLGGHRSPFGRQLRHRQHHQRPSSGSGTHEHTDGHPDANHYVDSDQNQYARITHRDAPIYFHPDRSGLYSASGRDHGANLPGRKPRSWLFPTTTDGV